MKGQIARSNIRLKENLSHMYLLKAFILIEQNIPGWMGVAGGVKVLPILDVRFKTQPE